MLIAPCVRAWGETRRVYAPLLFWRVIRVEKRASSRGRGSGSAFARGVQSIVIIVIHALSCVLLVLLLLLLVDDDVVPSEDVRRARRPRRRSVGVWDESEQRPLS